MKSTGLGLWMMGIAVMASGCGGEFGELDPATARLEQCEQCLTRMLDAACEFPCKGLALAEVPPASEEPAQGEDQPANQEQAVVHQGRTGGKLVLSILLDCSKNPNLCRAQYVRRFNDLWRSADPREEAEAAAR